ncbi:MAG: hypothetical protein ACOCYU_04530 [Brevefilum sp.]
MIGYIVAPESVSIGVFIQVIPDEVTPTLYAMQHVDAKPLSEFNFLEGDEVPVTVDCEVVTKAFDAVYEMTIETDNSK